MTDLVNQPTNRISRKVTYSAWAAGISAPVASIVGGLMTDKLGFLIDYQTEVKTIVNLTVPFVATLATGYFTRERRENMLTDE